MSILLTNKEDQQGLVSNPAEGGSFTGGAAGSFGTATTAANQAQLHRIAAEEARDAALESQSEAKVSEDNSKESELAAAASVTQLTDLTATATTLAEGSSATATYTLGTGVLELGIPIGADGADGPQGVQGPVGEDSIVEGPQGDQGIRGIKGATGDTGDTGADSTIAGPKGDQGIQGETGDTGADSTIAGPKGDQGIQGETGDTGADSTIAGPKGDQGTQGPQGPQGETGDTGADSTIAGPKGDQGPQGIKGDIGAAPINGVSQSVEYIAAEGQTIFEVIYSVGYVDVYVNGVRFASSDFTATNGTSITLALGASLSDVVFLQSFGSFTLAEVYPKDQSDALYDLKADLDQVLTDVPLNALFTDTVYDPTAIDAAIALNTAKVTNSDQSKSDIEALGILASSITGALPAIDGSSLTGIDALPTQTTHASKFLTTDGTTATWETVDVLPDQTGNSGKTLTTDGSVATWESGSSSINGTAERTVFTATPSQATFNVSYDIGYVDVYHNGIKLVNSADFTATTGTSIVLNLAAMENDTLDVIAYGTFTIADHYTKAQTDNLIKFEIDGGVSDSTYLITQLVDGGSA